MSQWRGPAGGGDAFAQHVAQRISGIPGVRAVTLGGSRAEGTHRPDSDWDFSLYYRGPFEPDDLAALGWAGEIFPGAIAVSLARTAHAVLAARGEWITNDKLLIDKAGLQHADMALAGLSADPQVLALAIATAERLVAEAVEPFGL